MQADEPGRRPGAGISKVKLAIGAASLFLFIVGIKRTYRSDDPEAPEVSEPSDQPDR